MASSIDRSVVKRIVLELLEEDEEFRLAVAAKVGLLEILQKLEEHDRKFNEILERLDRNEKILLRHEEEIRKIWEKLEEHDRKFNEILAELREHRKILERHEKILKKHEEILERQEKILERHEKILEKHGEMLGSHGETLGLLTESFLSYRIESEIRENARCRGEEIVCIKYRHMVDKKYEVDLYIETSKQVYIVEVKVRPSVRSVDKLVRVRDYLLKRETREVKAILVSFKSKTPDKVIDKAYREHIELKLY